MHCTSQRSRRTSSCRVARLFRDVADSLFSTGGAPVSSSSIPQVAVEFILSSLRCFGLLRTNLAAQVITLKFYGRIAFVTEGQAPVTNGLEVGIAAACPPQTSHFRAVCPKLPGACRDGCERGSVGCCLSG